MIGCPGGISFLRRSIRYPRGGGGQGHGAEDGAERFSSGSGVVGAGDHRGPNAQAMPQRPRWPCGQAAAGCCRCWPRQGQEQTDLWQARTLYGRCTALQCGSPIRGRVPQLPQRAMSASQVGRGGVRCRTVRYGTCAQGVQRAGAEAGGEVGGRSRWPAPAVGAAEPGGQCHTCIV